MVPLDAVVAHSPAMTHAIHLCHVYARALTPVLLVGATGTGKSLLARLIHALSGRSGKLVLVTCRELDDPLGMDSLLGHTGGAFTGAVRSRPGLLASAAGGTLVLEDAHRQSRALQTAFLRLLQDEVYRTLGADAELRVQCRIVACLNEEPDELACRGRLLPDLRSRYGWCMIRLPPLAERREDIAPLASHFLARCPRVTGVEAPLRFGPDVIPALESLPWHANVRELEQAVIAAYLNAQGAPWIRWDHLPPEFQIPLRFVRRADPARNRRAVLWALGRTGGHVRAAAKLLGVHPNTVGPLASEVRTFFRAQGGVASMPGRRGPGSCVFDTDTTRSREAEAANRVANVRGGLS